MGSVRINGAGLQPRRRFFVALFGLGFGIGLESHNFVDEIGNLIADSPVFALGSLGKPFVNVGWQSKRDIFCRLFLARRSWLANSRGSLPDAVIPCGLSVLRLRHNAKMLRINTRLVIADVVNHQPRQRKATSYKHHRIAVCSNTARSRSEHAVYASLTACSPMPACIGFFNLRPKQLFIRHRSGLCHV